MHSMTSPQATTAAPQAASVAPNQYHLHGSGITVSYYPNGFGPIPASGPIKFIYQDTHVALSFSANDVRTVAVEDLGTIVSVTLKRTVDVGSTSFSVLIPRVNVAPQGSPVAITTEGITTVHRTAFLPPGHAQLDTYTVTRLTGTASAGPLPL